MTDTQKYALLSIAFGALAGGIVSLILNTFQHWYRMTRLTCKLNFKPENRVGTRCGARIHNDYTYPIRSAYAYITINHKIDDIMDPPGHCNAFIKPSHKKILREDRLCWAISSPTQNPASIDICAGEHQLLDIINIDDNWIEIPSEKGWSSSQSKEEIKGSDKKVSRVFLSTNKNKVYKGKIKIVSYDTKPKVFNIEINANDKNTPIKLIDC